MKKILKDIRQQPTHKKERLILIIVSSVVVVLLIAWLIIGNTTRRNNRDNSNLIDDISTDIQDTRENRDSFPELFNN